MLSLLYALSSQWRGFFVYSIQKRPNHISATQSGKLSLSDSAWRAELCVSVTDFFENLTFLTHFQRFAFFFTAMNFRIFLGAFPCPFARPYMYGFLGNGNDKNCRHAQCNEPKGRKWKFYSLRFNYLGEMQPKGEHRRRKNHAWKCGTGRIRQKQFK